MYSTPKSHAASSLTIEEEPKTYWVVLRAPSDSEQDKQIGDDTLAREPMKTEEGTGQAQRNMKAPQDRFVGRFGMSRCILSPQGKAMDLDFLQFESMLTAECYQINGGAVFERLARAIHKPGTDPFPLRLRDSYPDHGIANLNSYQNVGLTASDMEAIEKQTCYVLKWTPSGFAAERKQVRILMPSVIRGQIV